MAIDFRGHRTISLDCCSLLNLYATRRMQEMLQALSVRCVVAEAVVGEAVYVPRGGESADAAEREPVDLQPLISTGLVEVWRPEKEAEYASFVSFAVDIDDGEAMACALALHRGAAVVTDDRKTVRILRNRVPQLAVFTTTQVLRFWAESIQLGNAALRAVLRDVEARARFVPGGHDPLQPW